MTETLADMVIRETFRGRKSNFIGISARSQDNIRAAMNAAKKFVLDDSMSSFLADLSVLPFLAKKVRQASVIESMRHGAMLPFPVTWVEFNGHAFRERLLEIAPSKVDMFGEPLSGIHDVPPRWGWLLEQHPQLAHCIRLTEFVDLSEADPHFPVGTVPFSIVWNCKDEPLPWHADTQPSELMHGILDYETPYIGVAMEDVPMSSRSRKFQIKHEDPRKDYTAPEILVEMSGVLRYALAFLATLNDVPTVVENVKPSRGFVAKGRYRKFVEHSKVRLNIPQRVDRARFARKVLALSRKRWHNVRAHWRLHQRNADDLCAPSSHEWLAMDDNKRAHCRHCHAWRTWIVLPHGRGDASLAMAINTFEVTHHAQ